MPRPFAGIAAESRWAPPTGAGIPADTCAASGGQCPPYTTCRSPRGRTYEPQSLLPDGSGPALRGTAIPVRRDLRAQREIEQVPGPAAGLGRGEPDAEYHAGGPAVLPGLDGPFVHPQLGTARMDRLGAALHRLGAGASRAGHG